MRSCCPKYHSTRSQASPLAAAAEHDQAPAKWCGTPSMLKSSKARSSSRPYRHGSGLWSLKPRALELEVKRSYAKSLLVAACPTSISTFTALPNLEPLRSAINSSLTDSYHSKLPIFGPKCTSKTGIAGVFR